MGCRVEPGHFTGWSLGARFYPVLYLLTRDGTGLRLGHWAATQGQPSREDEQAWRCTTSFRSRNSTNVEWNYKKSEVNALANFCFLTKDTNLDISDRLPSAYFPEVEEAHPGALASQWIPMAPELWRIENFRDFLEARKKLLAAEVNLRMEELLPRRHALADWAESGCPGAGLQSSGVSAAKKRRRNSRP